MITKVTITGADDSISPTALWNLSEKYPFVEWGILVSKKQMGNNRFPSYEWIKCLEMIKEFPNRRNINLSCHLCGRYVRDLLEGKVTDILELPLHIFDRIQINTHGERHAWKEGGFLHMERAKATEFIFQYDGENGHLLEMANKFDIRYSTLFDFSHGVGKLPNKWHDLLPDIKCGYAGGLGADNLAEQIPLIEAKAGNVETWIDMETKVRSIDDMQFDLEKVENCLRISSAFIPTQFKK